MTWKAPLSFGNKSDMESRTNVGKYTRKKRAKHNVCGNSNIWQTALDKHVGAQTFPLGGPYAAPRGSACVL